MITVGKLKQIIKEMPDETFILIKPGDSVFGDGFLRNGTIFADDRVFEFYFSTDISNGESTLNIHEVKKLPI